MAKNLTEWQLRLEKAAETMKALADPYRLHILDLLTEGEACHSELKEQVGLPPNLLSHHLRVLRQAGLVRTRHDTIDGRWIYYAANKDNLTYWRAWLGQFLNPARVQARPALCGPEGGQAPVSLPRPDEVERKRKRFVLFLCTGNSCRSQMAEGWARALKADRVVPYSAGTIPHPLNPRAVRVMAEAGIDISGQSSKHVDSLRNVPLDYVVTVCGAAHEACPRFAGRTRVVHVGFDDPPTLALTAATEEEALAHYRRVRDEIRAFVETLPESLFRLTDQSQNPENPEELRG
jgi:arsenate reductase